MSETRDVSGFHGLSAFAVARSGMGDLFNSVATFGNWGWSSLSNASATLNGVRYVDATDTSGGNANKRIASLIADLIARGIIPGTFS